MTEVIVRILLKLGEPDHFLGVDTLTVDDGGDLPVGAAGIKADAAAVHVAADGLRNLIGGGAGLQRQIQNFQIPLIELVHKVKVKLALTVSGIALLQPLGQLRAAADGNPEAAGGPQQELHIPLHIAVIRLRHFRRAMDKGVMDGDTVLVPLQSDGNGLRRILQISGPPDTKGDKLGVQLGGMLHLIFNA